MIGQLYFIVIYGGGFPFFPIFPIDFSCDILRPTKCAQQLGSDSCFTRSRRVALMICGRWFMLDG